MKLYRHTVETEQMMTRVLAEIRIDREEMTARLQAKTDTNQEKMDAKTDFNQREMKAEIRARNENFEVLRRTLVSRMVIHQARTEAIQEVAKMDAHQERMGASMNACRKETTACQEATEACQESKEPTSVETESVVVREEFPKEEAAVETAPKKRHVDRYIAVGRRRHLKGRIQDNARSWKKLAAARRGMTRRAGLLRRNGHSHRGPTAEQKRRKKRTRDSVVQGTRKGRTFGKRRGRNRTATTV
jgi:hypothetical protein